MKESDSNGKSCSSNPVKSATSYELFDFAEKMKNNSWQQRKTGKEARKVLSIRDYRKKWLNFVTFLSG